MASISREPSTGLVPLFDAVNKRTTCFSWDTLIIELAIVSAARERLNERESNPISLARELFSRVMCVCNVRDATFQVLITFLESCVSTTEYLEQVLLMIVSTGYYS